MVKILAVDDAAPNLLALTALLEPLGHAIVTAESGAEAVRLAARDEFALVLLDVMMPELDGFATLERLKQLPSMQATPVIFLSAFDPAPRMVERAYALGAIDYVLKPVAPEILVGKVDAFVTLFRQRRAIEERDAALVTKDRHLAVLAHDLKSPLQVVAVAVESLRRRGELDERVRATIDRVGRAAERMDGLVTDLLGFARTAATGVPIVRQTFDLRELCREVAGEHAPLPAGRRIDLQFAGDLLGQWDRARLHQAIDNLVRNAVKYGTGDISLAASGGGEVVEISVQNAGTPIARAQLASIFDPFERGEMGGTGLGLYIVREIVRAHGGEPSVRSDETATVFTLRLPRAAA